MNRLPAQAFRLLLAALLLPPAAAAQPDDWARIRAGTEARLNAIAAEAEGVLGVCAVDVVSGERIAVNADAVFPQASAIKVAVLMELQRQGKEGRLDLAQSIPVTAAAKAGGSGVLQGFSDGGSTLALQDLGVLMIVASDNTATNMLIDRLGMKAVNDMLAGLGLKRTRLQRRMMDQQASLRGDENIATPAEAARIMELLGKGEFVDRTVSARVLEVLRLGKTATSVVRGAVPGAVPVANKEGEIAGVWTEWAFVDLPGRPYALAMMHKLGTGDAPPAAMRGAAELIHGYFSRLARATKYGTYGPAPAK